MNEKRESEELERVGPPEPTLKNSLIVDEEEEEASDSRDLDVRTKGADQIICWYNGKEYSPGAELCAAGWRLQCQSNGTWRKFGGKC